MRVRDIEDEFLDFINKKYKINTFRYYRASYKKYTIPCLGDKEINNLVTQDYIDLLKYRISFEPKETTMYDFYTYIKTFNRYILSKGYIENDIISRKCLYSRTRGIYELEG